MEMRKLGPYQIGKKIGKGGMGAVYEAVLEDSSSGSPERVAIKALSPHMAMAEGFRERFEAEIDSLKKLQHEGIVRLYGYGEQDGVLFYSMELVEGTSLEEELNAGRRFDWRETIDIGIQVCRALKHAHDHGVVHRDIKPANLLLDKQGRIKIADFGIARLYGGTQLTTAGGVLGTADYMSPEQADGQPISERCDQYSLGGVMYALLAGRPPFRARTMTEMLQMQCFSEPEPVSRYAPDTPSQLNGLILQLLSKDPADRFPNARVLSRHMEAMERALSRPVEPVDEEPQSESLPTETPFSDPISSAEDVSPLMPTEMETAGVPSQFFDAPTIAELSSVADGPSAGVGSESDVADQPGSLVKRFTSLDDEVRLAREESHRWNWSLTAQIAVLLLALGGLTWGGWYLMQPVSADELYQQITKQIERDGTNDLRGVSAKLETFFERFADDPRTDQLRPAWEEWELQKLENRLRLKSNLLGSDAFSPVEQLYGAAHSVSRTNPAHGLAMFQALVALYDPTDATLETKTSTDMSVDQGDRRWLILARRQIQKLGTVVEELTATQRAALLERLTEASRLQSSRPAAARRMYQAIVELYDGQPWAESLVEEARSQIDDSVIHHPSADIN